jgi:hypothetical protein
MPAFGVVDGVQQGSVEAAHTAPYYFFGKDETFAIGGAIPFGLNSRQMSAWTFEGNGLKLMREFYAKYNIINFACGNTGAQMGGWFRKEIKSVADLKGLKMRIGGFAGKVLERMGGVPQNIPGGDIYPALEKGTIDAAEWIGPVRRPEAGLQQGRAVLLLPRLVGRRPAARPVHQPEGLRRAVGREQGHRRGRLRLRARRDAGQVRRQEPHRAQAAGGRGRQAAPVPGRPDDRGVQGRWRCTTSCRRRTRAGPRSTATSKFRADQNLWFRFTEATFDRFMQSQKL